jgi:hypothetical protein
MHDVGRWCGEREIIKEYGTLGTNSNYRMIKIFNVLCLSKDSQQSGRLEVGSSRIHFSAQCY